MSMVISVAVIFDTGATYSYSSNKGDFLKLEEKTFSRNLKGIAKGLEIYGFGIVEYSVRSESGRMIALRAQAYYLPGLPKTFAHDLPTRHSYIRRIQGYLHSSFS